MSDRKVKNHGVNVGTSLILVAFVLICLVAFAALSFASANADLTLAKQTIERKDEYIKACNAAEEKISQIDNFLQQCYNESSTENDYWSRIDNTNSDIINNNDTTYSFDDHRIELTIKNNDKVNIKVVLQLNFPTDTNTAFYDITFYTTESNSNGITDFDKPNIEFLF